MLVWAYAGLVPKLLGPHPEELALAAAVAPAGPDAGTVVAALGVAEVAFAALLLVGWHRRWLFAVSGLATLGVVVASLYASPGLLAHPLSPVPTGVAMLGLAAVGHVAGADLPSARRCITDRAASELEWTAGQGGEPGEDAATDPTGGEPV